MINLIPNEEKKKVFKDFYLRFVAVFFIMLGASLVFASAAILPAYFTSSIEESLISARLKTQQNEPISLPDQNTLAVIKDLKGKLALIEENKKNNFIFSQKVINEIILKKTPSIKITQISYRNDPESGKSIDISGVASSREALLAFRRALEDDPSFSKVELPISNFVRESNIKFSLSIIPL